MRKQKVIIGSLVVMFILSGFSATAISATSEPPEKIIQEEFSEADCKAILDWLDHISAMGSSYIDDFEWNTGNLLSQLDLNQETERPEVIVWRIDCSETYDKYCDDSVDATTSEEPSGDFFSELEIDGIKLWTVTLGKCDYEVPFAILEELTYAMWIKVDTLPDAPKVYIWDDDPGGDSDFGKYCDGSVDTTTKSTDE